MKNFNIRVYGFIIHPDKGLLLSYEKGYGTEFVKFPGGGLEWGEGPKEALKRELLEELNLEFLEAIPVFVTENFVASSFDDSQVIGIYYKILVQDLDFLKTIEGERIIDKELEPYISYQRLFWERDFNKVSGMLTFEMDKIAWNNFIENSRQ